MNSLVRARFLPLLVLAVMLAGAPARGGIASAAQASRDAAGSQQRPAGTQTGAGETAGRQAGQARGPEEPGLAEASEQAEHAAPFKLWGKWVIPGWVVELLRWSNFVILFGILGYLLRQPMRQFFAERGRAIVEGIARGRRAREEAAARLRDIEGRLVGLDAEIAQLRQAAMNEAQADHQHLRERARAEAEKIRVMAEQEIASLVKQARAELRNFAAALAVQLAEQRIRARLTPERQEALLRRYAQEIKSAQY